MKIYIVLNYNEVYEAVFRNKDDAQDFIRERSDTGDTDMYILEETI